MTTATEIAMGLSPSRRNVLIDRLTEKFIWYQWRLEHPMPEENESWNVIIDCYFHDQIFHARVQALVAAVMHEIDKVLGS